MALLIWIVIFGSAVAAAVAYLLSYSKKEGDLSPGSEYWRRKVRDVPGFNLPKRKRFGERSKSREKAIANKKYVISAYKTLNTMHREIIKLANEIISAMSKLHERLVANHELDLRESKEIKQILAVIAELNKVFPALERQSGKQRIAREKEVIKRASWICKETQLILISFLESIARTLNNPQIRAVKALKQRKLELEKSIELSTKAVRDLKVLLS